MLLQRWSNSMSRSKMRFRLSMVASLLCLFAAALVGCGGSGSPSSSTSVAVLYPNTYAYTTVDPTAPQNYAAPALPAHYDAALLATRNQTTNVLTDKGATLGRVLFNDVRLSFNNTKSCASCHVQSMGFADTAQFSTGFSGSAFTSAHAMRLANVAFYQAPAGGTATMFWDKRAATLEIQATQPIQNAVEMGFDSSHGGFAALVTKMQALPYYTELFTWVFGDSAITEARVQNALAQYQRAIISSNSKWDRAYAVVFAANGRVNTNQNFARPLDGTDIPAANRFTASEERGRILFIAPPPPNGTGKGCAGCHQPPTFALNSNSRSNGLDAGETRIFKSPSLKNVGVQGRFMHDGRFATLAEVMDHYDTGILASGTASDGRPALDVNRLPAGGLNLTAQDKLDIIAFLNTLNDDSLASDGRFSNPFKK